MISTILTLKTGPTHLCAVENKENLSPSKLHLYRERHDYKDYKIGTRKEPPVLIKHVEITGNDILEERLNIDLVWPMTANLKNEDVPLPPLGNAHCEVWS